MARLTDIDRVIEMEVDKYNHSIVERRGEATTPRQEGQRRRRRRDLIEKLYAAAEGIGDTTDMDSDKPQTIVDSLTNVVAKESKVTESVGYNIEKFGVPPGAVVVDTHDYNATPEPDIIDEPELIKNPTLTPRDGNIFSGRDNEGGRDFLDWMKRIYLRKRPNLKMKVYNHYWYNKGGRKLKTGGVSSSGIQYKKKTPEQVNRSLEFLSWKLRSKMSEVGIHPTSITVYKNTTDINYGSKTHTLNKGSAN
jgi:hypothetical protein